ncbi:hypothetical protein [Streptomyces sp. NPDC049881]|uniref:hypothetical protein n=1 Tax=Streptomyces sp. NPDC049881 TaxID=3155778 RepID=UPI00343295C6
MPHLDFDHKDVEAKGRKPWKQRAAFRAEIEPDDMGDLAAQYVRAAPGAHDAGDLAERATEMSAGAGELDGRSLIVSEERIDETARGLQGNGNGIDETVRLILESMHEANDALDAVNLVIDEPLIGLDATLRAHQRDAVTEWNEWVELRQDAVADRMAALRGNPGNLGPPTPLTLWRRGDHVTLSALPTLNGGLYTWSQLPDSLAERIRQRHIAAVAEAAEAADDRITREKDDYRAAMMHKALRLGEQDYDLDAGPFTLFTTPEMGDFAGARLHEELGRQNPDMLTVKLYTEGLAALLDGIVEEDGDPIPFAELDPDQRAYLTAALGSLTTEDLTVLGRFASVPGAGLPGTVAFQDEVLERIANGLNVLTDPSLGGYSVSDDAGWRKLPPGVRDVLALAETDDPAFLFVDHLGEWNGFGALMSHADVPPSDAWAKRLARAAMDAQLMSMDQYLQSDVTTLQANTGSSDLLGLVGLNSGASARLIGDDEFRADLLSAYWEDSLGVARFIDSGTTVPDGVSWNEPEARQYIDAAFHFMVDAAERHDVIVGDHGMLNTGRFDHRGLQWALGDTMLNYMDFISQMSEDNQLGTKDMKLFGFDYAYSFDMAGGHPAEADRDHAPLRRGELAQLRRRCRGVADHPCGRIVRQDRRRAHGDGQLREHRQHRGVDRPCDGDGRGGERAPAADDRHARDRLGLRHHGHDGAATGLGRCPLQPVDLDGAGHRVPRDGRPQRACGRSAVEAGQRRGHPAARRRGGRGTARQLPRGRR